MHARVAEIRSHDIYIYIFRSLFLVLGKIFWPHSFLVNIHCVGVCVREFVLSSDNLVWFRCIQGTHANSECDNLASISINRFSEKLNYLGVYLVQLR